MKVIISAGHSKLDQGTSFGPFKENELTIRVRDEFKRLYTGEALYPPDNLTLKETIDWINNWLTIDKNALAVEIHFNSHKDDSVRGTEVYYFGTPRYAAIFAQKISEVIGIPNRGSKPDSMSYVGELGFLRKLNCPSVLVEICYLTNRADRDMLEVNGITSIAKGMINAINILTIEELKTKQINLLQKILLVLQDKLKKLLG